MQHSRTHGGNGDEAGCDGRKTAGHPDDSTEMLDRGRGEGPDENEIVERVFDAVIDQRLPPGTRLTEQALCEAFGVGRMRIRRSLLLLASREIVELHSNRGAFVSKPTPEQAREVFEARRIIEPDVACMAAGHAQGGDIRRLRAHLDQEHAAHMTGNRHDIIRLSGSFHVHLADIARNGTLTRTIKELVTRTSLIIGMFGSAGASTCREGEHARIVDALEGHDGDRAAQLMAAHLAAIEANVDLVRGDGDPVDLVGLFGKHRRHIA
ncbi:MAG: GntR family transcriptional regulator [Geminicoccaceae bacterium]|nr:GntR family transcriptional regulator [Geminicoccaceae bacterium]